MTETEILTAIRTILVVHITHADDEEGDKYLSDPNLAIEALYKVAINGDDSQAKRDGFLPR
jgi:hypothetical protein